MLRIHFIAGLATIAAILVASPSVAQTPSTGDEPDPDRVGHNAIPSDDGDYQTFRARISVGANYTQGKYETSSTSRNFSAPILLRMEYEPLTLRVSVPLLVNSGGNLVGESVDTGLSGTKVGLGDVLAGLTYTIYPSTKGLPLLDLTTQVKIPTAAEGRGLGTGHTDVTLQAELLQSFGPVYVFGGGGYRFKGGAAFDDIFHLTAGGGVRIAKTANLGVAYDFREASVDGSSDSHELSPYLSLRTGEHTRIGPYAIIGLNNGAPDWGVGLTWSYEF